jgi:hypothetical protein
VPGQQNSFHMLAAALVAPSSLTCALFLSCVLMIWLRAHVLPPGGVWAPADKQCSDAATSHTMRHPEKQSTGGRQVNAFVSSAGTPPQAAATHLPSCACRCAGVHAPLGCRQHRSSRHHQQQHTPSSRRPPAAQPSHRAAPGKMDPPLQPGHHHQQQQPAACTTRHQPRGCQWPGQQHQRQQRPGRQWGRGRQQRSGAHR